MKYRLFQYPLPAPPELEDLNAFLGAQRVAAVTHHLAQMAGGAMLVFVVETVGPSPAKPSGPMPRKTESLPRADIRPRVEKARGGASCLRLPP